MRLLAVFAAMAMMLAIAGPAMAETTTNEGSTQESDYFISVEGDEDFDFDEDDYFSVEDELFYFDGDVEFEDGEFEFDEDETFFFVEG
jgi:hypothetical protein